MAHNRESHFDKPPFLARIVARDEKAIEELVRAYTRRLCNTAIGLGFDPDGAEELVQQTWVTFYEKADRFEGRSRISTFLYGILYNKARERRRERSDETFDDAIENRMDRRFDAAGRWLSPPLDPEKFVLLTERVDLVELCLDTLPTPQRMAFTLKELEGLSSKEMCNVLGVSLTNLRTLLFRARNRLRECIESKDRGNR